MAFKKGQAFLIFFINQCSLKGITGDLPANLTFYSRNQKYSVSFWYKGIQNVNPTKTDSHDNNSISMLKICDSTMNILAELIFFWIFFTLISMGESQYGSYTSIFDKQILKTYRPVSLLQIWGKTFEKTIANDLISYFSYKYPYLVKSIRVETWRFLF